MSERVCVVIPNWNGRHLLTGCLLSLRRQTFRDFAVTVVDNGSTDGSVDLLRSDFPEVRVVAHTENLGFSAAMNAGIAAGTGQYVVALNNDTEVDPDWLAELVGAMDAHPEAGFGASKLLDYRDRSVIDTVGDGYSATGLAYKIGSRQKDRPGREPFEVFGACAAASIYRRAMLDEIGGFDVDFFAYMEDVDLSIRARLAGYRCIGVPTAVVYHMGAASSGGTASAFSVRLTIRNLIAILIKDIPAPLLPRFVATATAIQAGAVLHSLLTGRRPWLRRNLPAYGRGLLDAARTAPAMLRKRRAVQRLRRISARDFARLMADSERLRRSFATSAGSPDTTRAEAR